jgi:three-Cys-motif partner protein
MAGDIPQGSGDGGFFDEIQAAAVLKHGILSRYLHVYATKTGTHSPGKTVVYFDGYAGPGRYEDGRAGSPLIAARVARKVASQRNPRTLKLFLVEKDRAAADRLRHVMATEGDVLGIGATIHGGEAAEFLDPLLAECYGLPLFGLLDPYGRGLPPQSLVRLMNRSRDRQGRPQTELLLNFSDPMVRRTGGLLTSQNQQMHDQVTLARMDQVCGGDWWRKAYTVAGSNTAGVQAVVSGYCQRLEQATKSKAWSVPVRNRAHQEPRYYLIFLSRHPDGLWEFGEAVSGGAEDWRKFVNAAVFGEGDTLFDSEALLSEIWISTIAANITRLITEEAAPFVVRDRYEAVMGDALGLAREKHIRAAVKRLYADGRTASNGIGKIDAMTIKPPAW